MTTPAETGTPTFAVVTDSTADITPAACRGTGDTSWFP